MGYNNNNNNGSNKDVGNYSRSNAMQSNNGYANNGRQQGAGYNNGMQNPQGGRGYNGASMPTGMQNGGMPSNGYNVPMNYNMPMGNNMPSQNSGGKGLIRGYSDYGRHQVNAYGGNNGRSNGRGSSVSVPKARNTMKMFIACLLIFVIAAGVVFYMSHTSNNGNIGGDGYAFELTINKPLTTELEKGTEMQLTYKADNQDPSQKSIDDSKITWKSDNPSVISISDKGVVKALDIGDAVIKLGYEGIERTDSIALKVVASTDTEEPDGGGDTDRIASINIIKPSDTTLVIDETVPLDFETTPSDVDRSKVVWSSSDNDILTITQQGVVKAKSKGTATIKLSSTVDSSISDSITFTVSEGAKIESITITKPDSTDLVVGGTLLLDFSTTPTNVDKSKVIWSNDNTSVLSINQQGFVQAIGKGKATVTLEYQGTDLSDSITFNVVEAEKLESLSITRPNSTDLLVNDTVTLDFETKPSNVDRSKMIWSSSDEKILTITQSGLLKAIAKGKATITLTYKDDASISDSIEFVVDKIDTLTNISILEQDSTLMVGENLQLHFILEPSTIDSTLVTWTSSKPNIASISESGNIEAKSEGSTVITLGYQGSNLTASIGIDVEKIPETQLESISIIKPDSTEITVDDTLQLDFSTVPADMDKSRAEWSSTNEDYLKIDKNGKVSAVGVGSATVLLNYSGSDKFSTINLTVVDRILPPTSIDINGNSKGTDFLLVGENATLNLNIEPSGVDWSGLIYSTSDNNIISVDADGNLKALKTGSATITVGHLDNKDLSSSVEIEVYKDLTELSLETVFDRYVYTHTYNLSDFFGNREFPSPPKITIDKAWYQIVDVTNNISWSTTTTQITFNDTQVTGSGGANKVTVAWRII